MSSSSSSPMTSPTSPAGQPSLSTTVIAAIVVALLIGSFIVIGGISYGIQRYQVRNKALHAQRILSDIEAQLVQSRDIETKEASSIAPLNDSDKLTGRSYAFDARLPRPVDIEDFFKSTDMIKCKTSPPSKHRRSFAVHIKRCLTTRNSNAASSSFSSLESISTQGEYDPMNDIEAIKRIIAQRKAVNVQRGKENYLKAQMEIEYISQHDLLKGKKRSKDHYY